MNEILAGLESVLSLLKMGFYVFAALVAIIAAAVICYVIRSTCSPLVVIARWLVSYNPAKPSPILIGISHGIRLLVWSGALGAVLWCLFGACLEGSDLMNFQEESSNQTFVASTAVVAFGGLIVLVLLVIYFRPKPKPEITERIVEVSAVPFDPPAPPPPPPPAPKAEPKPPPPALPSPPPPKTKVEVRTGGVWDGIWRLPTLELPMFEFRQNGETISGTYSPPTWSDIYSFTHGIIRGDTAQLAVRDELHRVFFRFRRYKKDGIAIVEQWITPEDALEFYRNAQNLVRNPPKKKRRLTPQEIIALRIAVQAALASAGKVQRVGVFYRVVNQGERKLPENLRTK